jgi:hypothetical protein
MKSPLFNIDKHIKSVGLADSDGRSIDSHIASIAFTFVEYTKHPEWLLQQITESPRIWSTLRQHADRLIRLAHEEIELAIYGPR